MKKLISLILLSSILFTGFSFLREKPQYDKQVVTIHQGDTLWQIAERHCGESYVLDYIEDLKALPENKAVLSKTFLAPGDKVVVLVEKK